MSQSYVTIQTDDIEKLSEVPEGTIVAILDPNTKVEMDVEKLVLPCFEDQRIGFVYTDFVVKNGPIEFIEFLDGKSLVNCPFFMRNVSGLNMVKNESLKINIMQQLVSKGFVFEHVAEPVISTGQ